MTNNDVPLDKSGHPIAVGSYIVYGHALGRCAGLRFGKVLKVTKKLYDALAHANETGRKWSVTVIGHDDDILLRYNPTHFGAGTPGVADRILVIPPEWLTEEIRSALDSFVLKKGKTCNT